MSEQSRESTAWESSGSTTHHSGTGYLLDHESVKEAAELCPICVLLLDEEGLQGEDLAQGTALFAKYMEVKIQIISDGQGHVTSSEGWSCGMCGAKGEGKIPEFHAKPKKEGTNES